MIVRSQIDACLSHSPGTNAKHFKAASEIDSYTSASSRLHVTDQINVIEAGQLVEQSSLVELKTRSVKNLEKGMLWKEELPQLIFSQTEQQFMGVHDGYGTFFEILRKSIDDPDAQEEAVKLRPAFYKLRALLGQLQDLAREKGRETRLSLVCRAGTREMDVYERLPSSNYIADVWLRRFYPGAVPRTQEKHSGFPSDAEYSF